MNQLDTLKWTSNASANVDEHLFSYARNGVTYVTPSADLAFARGTKVRLVYSSTYNQHEPTEADTDDQR